MPERQPNTGGMTDGNDLDVVMDGPVEYPIPPGWEEVPDLPRPPLPAKGAQTIDLRKPVGGVFILDWAERGKRQVQVPAEVVGVCADSGKDDDEVEIPGVEPGYVYKVRLFDPAVPLRERPIGRYPPARLIRPKQVSTAGPGPKP